MKIHFLTIVLDGMPFISFHYPMMRSLPFQWEWHVVEGVAENKHCTSWCKAIPPRLSQDGTTQYLESIKFDPRVHVYQRPSWNGKIEMVNTPLKTIKEPGLLWQIDSDEIWTAAQVERMRRMFLQCRDKTEAHFFCRYFVGPDIITVGKDCYGNYTSYEWNRVWRFEPGMKFDSHEPPKFSALSGKSFSHDETFTAGLVFDHFAYATESAVAFKESYYGREKGLYVDAVENWKRLQENTIWPVKLKRFLPWVDDRVEAIRI